jgi:hypothetical protein
LASLGGPPYNQTVKRDQVLQRLAEARAELAGLGVRSLDLFGSVARGEAGPDSDDRPEPFSFRPSSARWRTSCADPTPYRRVVIRDDETVVHLRR